MKKEKSNFLYKKPLFYLFNFVFFFIRIIVNFFYYTFVWPVKKMISVYNFLIQVNIYLKIERSIKKVFETNLRNYPCENNLGSNDVKTLLKSYNYFENKKNKPEITGTINEDLYTFDYNYRNIYLNITKSFRKKMYFIELKMNGISLINVERYYNFRSAKYTTLFL